MIVVGMLLGARDQHALERVELRIALRRSRRAPTAGSRSRPGRCASARCAAARRRRRSARPSRCSTVMWMSSSSAPRARRRAHIRRRSGRAPRGSPRHRHADDALIAKHRRMRLRRGDVLAPQPLVEGDRGVDSLHELGRLRPEAAAPGSLCGRFLGHRRAGATRAALGPPGRTRGSRARRRPSSWAVAGSALP